MIFKINSKLLTTLTLLISLIFISKAFYNLSNAGSDFSASYILSKNFWSGNDIFLMKEQNPFYPHLHYIVLFPLTLLEFEKIKIIWFTLNLFFFFGSIVILKKKLLLDSAETKVLIILSVASTPFTNMLALGNLSFFVLFFLLIYYFYSSIFLKGIALSLALVKYNISFLFVILVFLQRKPYVAGLFLMINLLAASFYFYHAGVNDFFKIFDPILTILWRMETQTTDGVVLGLFNIHNVLIDLELRDYYFFVFFIILIPVLYFFKSKKNIKKDRLLILIILCSLTLVHHALYDFIILVPFLAYIIKNRSSLRFFWIYCFAILNIFYFYKINVLSNYLISKEIFSAFGFFLLIISFVSLAYCEKN